MTTIHIIAGPTASGKSAKALEMALKTNGVIINCDSMQIYDDLPILTAQPSADDKQAVSHVLYGSRHANFPCSAGNWRELVEPIIQKTIQNEQTPIIVGGSGLYIKALTDGLSPIPDIPDNIRAEASAMQKQLGNPAFHVELAKRDPIMAERFHAHHTARLIRAWEVLEATGQSLSEWQKMPRKKPPEDWHFEIHKIIPERNILYDRCNQRFLWMIENGALEEVVKFQTRIDNGDVKDGVPLTKALGFRHLRSYLNNEISKTEAIERAQGETRRYAKRQTTWFKHQM